MSMAATIVPMCENEQLFQAAPLSESGVICTPVAYVEEEAMFAFTTQLVLEIRDPAIEALDGMEIPAGGVAAGPDRQLIKLLTVISTFVQII